MEQQVGKAATDRVKLGSIVGSGTGSTTAFAIQFLGDLIRASAQLSLNVL